MKTNEVTRHLRFSALFALLLTAFVLFVVSRVAFMLEPPLPATATYEQVSRARNLAALQFIWGLVVVYSLIMQVYVVRASEAVYKIGALLLLFALAQAFSYYAGSIAAFLRYSLGGYSVGSLITGVLALVLLTAASWVDLTTSAERKQEFWKSLWE